jgi:menaquinone-dependent protoporphyrinogen oxidase
MIHMRVLVTAASKYGSTAEIGRVIGEVLSASGLDVVVREPAAVSGLAEFDAVVLGSGVYAGRWLAPARALVDRSASELSAREVWLFSSGPVGDPPKPEAEAPEAASHVARTGAQDHRVFAGRLSKADLSLPEKLLVGALRAPEGDFRPWDDIRAWATEIAATLKSREHVTAAS